MKVLVADCETNGLLPQLTKLHCLAFVDFSTGAVHSFADQPGHRPIEEGLRELEAADMTVWHNGIKFDIPAIRKVYPWWKPRGVVRDSMLTASLVWPKNPVLFEKDRPLVAKGKLPGNLMGRHSLEAYGYRLGEYKGDYKGGWENWSPEMHSYCEQDVRVTAKLWARILEDFELWKKQRPRNTLECIEIEHEVAWIIARQEQYGVGFDHAAAGHLLGELTIRHDALLQQVTDMFPPKVVRTPFIPKVTLPKRGYQKGVLTYKEKLVPFNPQSRDHVAERLIELGWKPVERTADGKWKVDDDILRTIPIPEAQKLADLFDLSKRIGTLSTGKEALLKHATARGTLHHRCDSNGAVTGRATHSKPNVNIPKVKKGADGKILLMKEGGYGFEFRGLFRPVNGGIQVGVDADSLEARVEAGYTVAYDGGSYRETILSGNKDNGTDLHTRNRNAIRSVVPSCSRDTAKTTKYAWTYGAGDWKIGFAAGATGSREKVAGAGKKIRGKLLAASPGLEGLVKAIEGSLEKRNYLWGLDGRKLFIRSKNAALNTLFQSAGAVIFKRAMIIRDLKLTGVLPSIIGTQGPEASKGLIPGKDYEQMLWVHDEVQMEARTEAIAKRVGKAMEEAIKEAGEHFKFDCPMAGNADHGRNWAECH